MLCYDYILTLSQEVRCIWMRKKTGATILYLLIRYVCLVSYCILPAATYPHVYQTGGCIVEVRLQRYHVAFSALRALALSGMNWKLATLVFILASGPFAVNIVRRASSLFIGSHWNRAQCSSLLSGVAVARSCVIASDVLVIAITWWH
ncbi:hypothetical protein GY45DRAFT_1219949, partial [Cubamyces sp. BRFM 1775]